MNSTDPEPLTEKKVGEIFQDLEHPEAYIYIITRGRIYQFSAVTLTPMLEKYCRKSIKTDDVGIPLLFTGEDGEDPEWQRWQNRSDL